MANMVLQAQSPLAAYDQQFGQTRLSEHSGVSIHSIALAQSPENALASIASTLGAAWPDVGHSTSNANHTHRLLGLQKDQVFVLSYANAAVSHSSDEHHTNDEITQLPTLHDDAYVTDQSDSWAGLVIDGPSARTALERICPIDLHPDAFKVGQVTRTSMEHLAVIILRENEARYLLLSPCSSAHSFLHAVETSLKNVQL